jgi:hypothetical protein
MMVLDKDYREARGFVAAFVPAFAVAFAGLPLFFFVTLKHGLVAEVFC